MTEKPPESGPGSGWEPLPETEEPGRALGPRLMVAGLALVAAAVLVAQNHERTETTFFFWSREFPVWGIIVWSMVLGALLGQAVPTLYRRRKDRTPRKDRKARKDPKG